MPIPKTYIRFKKSHPKLMKAYEALGDACRRSGPLDKKTAALVKLGIAIGSGLEGGTHSAARKALAAGCTAADLDHVAILCTTTLGFPAMMRARAWVADVVEEEK